MAYVDDEGNEWVAVNVTCHTEGCENSGVTITLDVPDPEIKVICGACQTEIQDVVTGGDDGE